MNFNNHSRLEGCHAFLSASGYHWINYSDEKLVERYDTQQAAKLGTELHEFASSCIRLGQKLPRSKKTLNCFVNDAIGFRMQSEQILYYSENCFGTADTISFHKNVLRIHDFKSGVVPAHMEQLYIYAALFCLEYKTKPGEIDIETRLYQFDDILIDNPGADIILPIMDKIIVFDKIINKIKEQES